MESGNHNDVYFFKLWNEMGAMNNLRNFSQDLDTTSDIDTNEQQLEERSELQKCDISGTGSTNLMIIDKI